MNVTCPHCGTVFRVDPARVPVDGARARCSRCAGIFLVERTERAPRVEPIVASEIPAPIAAPAPSPAPASAPDAAPAPPAPPPFGAADPHGKARRLARALASDIVAYYPDRRERSVRDGTLRQEFREEIRKSWEEYASQVGDQMARGTPYFREALNEILAGGERLF